MNTCTSHVHFEKAVCLNLQILFTEKNGNTLKTVFVHTMKVNGVQCYFGRQLLCQINVVYS